MNPLITADEVANYVVCPEAWRLKYQGKGQKVHNKRTETGKQLRKAWIEHQLLSTRLAKYAKVTYSLLVALVIIVFLMDLMGSGYTKTPTNDASVAVPQEIIFLLLVLGLIIFMWDFFERRSKKFHADSGLGEKTKVISLRGNATSKDREYYSSELGLSSKPDAIVEEDGFFIPVDIKPMTNKVRDRHVIALFVHMQLVEEIQGIQPPYGILRMGEKGRIVKVKNTEEKRRWLAALLAEMRSIINGIPAIPAPAKQKCRHCDVREICAHKVS